MALPNHQKPEKNAPKRFYVGNLFNDVNERDLKKLFVIGIKCFRKHDIKLNAMRCCCRPFFAESCVC